MKSCLIVLLAVVNNSVSVMAGCQRMKFTFNLKPSYISGAAEDYGCGDLENDLISDMISNEGIAKMSEFGYTNVAASVVRKGDDCPSYDCVIQAADACLPYCVDISFCTSQDMDDEGITVLSANDIGLIQQHQIQEMRKDLPECLGIKNQFMADLHFAFA